MTRPEWAEYIVASAHADTAAMGALIAGEAQRSRRVQLEAAQRQIDATARQTAAVRETAQATQRAVTDAADRQVAAQGETTTAVADLASSVDAMSDRLADSVDIGFLRVQQTVGEGLETLDKNLDVLAGMVRGGFELVGKRLVEQTEVLGTMAAMTANPLTTAAEEHYRRGVASLRQGWLDEAIVELVLASEKDATNPAPRYALGVARAALDEPGAAFASLLLAVKYAAADERWGPLAASAVILLRSVAAPEQADEVAAALDTALRLAPTCAELLVIRAVHHDAPDDLVAAFTLAPELALVAIQAGVPGAEEAAETVANDPSSPVHARREIQRLIAASGDEGFGVNIEPADIPQAMIGHTAWLRTALPTVEHHAMVVMAQRLADAELSVTTARAREGLGRHVLDASHENAHELRGRLEEAADAVGRAEAAVEAYRTLPAATATLVHRARVENAFLPFVRPVIALIVTVFLIAVAAPNGSLSFLAGMAAFVTGILFVVWSVRALRQLAEQRAAARREAAVAAQIREQQVLMAQHQRDRARSQADRDLDDARRALRTVERQVDAADARSLELAAELDDAAAEHRAAQAELARLTSEAERYRRPILALLPRVAPGRVRPLGEIAS
ncbi:hypothetical protein [Microbacterium telephonicum]|uniref:Tetratricopeptide repeat protein n=1 Tax=Microbacterium telephonicum TaxID=1714841 RepID=A0A498CC36_9MICO|nr:hypothetical protein [Microbacterium telephonicum]RLK52226.1 hypothetical protein C7474_0158 [Microbacterium telephonicum]